MNWRMKAAIQNVIAMLPSPISYAAYYAMQRRLGGLRRPAPAKRMAAGVRMADFIETWGGGIEGRTVVEVGTGHRLCLPMALWLCGAGEIHTVDLNPYLKPELVIEDIDYLRSHRGEIVALFGRHALAPGFDQRFQRLLARRCRLPELLDLMHIRYLAPGDATRLPLAAGSADYHVSYTVLEHIPPKTLTAILSEGKRVVGTDGLLVHHVDFSDHFSHSDRSISAVNFLRFTERQWQRHAGNRYMYHNRLRIDELLALADQSGLTVLESEAHVDERSLRELSCGLRLDGRFAGKSPQVNATSSVWLVASARQRARLAAEAA